MKSIIVKCKECGFSVSTKEDAEIMFGVNRLEFQSIPFYRNRCRLCRQTISDEKKQRNRFIAKARNMVYTHVKRFNAKGYDLKPIDLHNVYGWPEIEVIARRIENEYKGACFYCGTDFQDTRYMVHGLADLSLDIENPAGGPSWGNVRFCCLTCNRIKSQMGAIHFVRYLSLIKHRIAFLETKPKELFLFDLNSYKTNQPQSLFPL